MSKTSFLETLNRLQTLGDLEKSSFQGNQHIAGSDSATAKANTASDAARSSNNKDEHRAAMQAHQSAADMHRKAGNHTTASTHDAAARGHALRAGK